MGKDKKKSKSRSKSNKKKEKKEKKEKKSKAKKDSIKKESIKKKESVKKESQKKNKKQKESKKKEKKSRKKSHSTSPINAQKKQAQDEQKLKDDEQKRLSRLMKAKLIKFQNSDDDDDDDKKEFVYKDPEVIEPILPPDEQLYDWSQKNQEKQIQDALKKCRLVGEKLFYDSDGIEEDDNAEEQYQEENGNDNRQDAKMQEEEDQEAQKQVEKVEKQQQERFLIGKKTLNNDSDSDSEDENASKVKYFTKNLQSISKLKELQQQPQQQFSRPQIKRRWREEQYDDQEEDPLEAFMRQVETEATQQADEDERRRKEEEEKEKKRKQAIEEELRKLNAQKVITYEDIIQNSVNQTNEKKNTNGMEIEQGQETQNQQKELEQQQIIEEDEEDNKFYEQFMKELKKKELEEKMRQREDEDEAEDVDLEQQQMLALLEEEPDIFDKQKKLEKKELKPVDHSTIDYQPFRKDFYREVSELVQMTPEEAKKLRQQLGDIKVRGKDVPKPIQNWYQCGLNDRVLNVLIEKKKFINPFPIQAQAVPCIMSGRDFIGIAETGSGKTLAYLLPLLRHVLDQPALKDGDGPIAIIMAPTRELAHQIYVNCRWFTSILNLNVVCCVGGAGIAGQLSDLKRGTEIVVCTPGRMIDVLTTSNGKITNLRRVTYVVIDEADRMFDLGFEPQICKIIQNIRPDRQLVMFSATFPKNVEQLAKRVLRKPIECIVGGRGQAGGNIEQIIEFMDESDKLYKLLLLFQEWYTKGSILIFVEKQTEADDLFKELLKYGYKSFVLHGGMDPQDREFTIHDFKKGIRTIMVATSVLARGLDIKHICLVINFSCPNHMEDYIHRIGRTGRAGQKGTAITFFTPQDEHLANDLVYLLEKSEQQLPEKLKEYQKSFMEKVKAGEAKIYRNKNRAGGGFTFGPEEEQKFQDFRAQMRKKFGLEGLMMDEQSSDDEKVLEEIAKGKLSEEERLKKQEERDRVERERIMQLIKDPALKSQILSEATKAANLCINSGGSREQVANAAMDAIKRVLKQHSQVNKSIEGGIEEAMQIINEFEERERNNHDFVSYDFEINDYPTQARLKILSKEFLNMIHELTNCQISQRGSLVEPGKKPLPGQKKLFLRIEGENEYFVMSAYKEIKRMAQDLTLNQIQDNYAGIQTNSKLI
ncbi:unnamed protein product (macronuclear) [Paramecium tetraurelia]|uniref:RNA helicase n=1 Tax=Paramecium tetraurelia TaxID=5888 RepID=Q6BG49_PARTE|nr:RNA helicase [Paramecium tetraurelia strain d4-2]XP_001423312.1 uncharacterized protein GSPATT00000349001 [Paramecium tetraurelia]CAH03371.1 RNA helicase, putative [Paramecium tetraurelia]CAK55914.1 unnamed protein product [Paramecium tetraurelia]|eukprot:XP_001423312.1 hypothetical protein (macronuclear) [Paramecium tetraurelia strain d4-2]